MISTESDLIGEFRGTLDYTSVHLGGHYFNIPFEVRVRISPSLCTLEYFVEGGQTVTDEFDLLPLAEDERLLGGKRLSEIPIVGENIGTPQKIVYRGDKEDSWRGVIGEALLFDESAKNPFTLVGRVYSPRDNLEYQKTGLHKFPEDRNSFYKLFRGNEDKNMILGEDTWNGIRARNVELA